MPRRACWYSSLLCAIARCCRSRQVEGDQAPIRGTPCLHRAWHSACPFARRASQKVEDLAGSRGGRRRRTVREGVIRARRTAAGLSGGRELVAVELEEVVGGRQQPPFRSDG